MTDLANLTYVDRVNRAIDYILANMDGSLKLEDVARAAHFSPFHFHRVFRSLMGETLNQFVKRIRLDRALRHLTHRPEAPLTQVALACGFSSSSDFSRAFKQRFGVPPRAFDLQRYRESMREEYETALTPPEEREMLAGLPPGENPDGFEIRIRDVPARHVAYIRVLRPYEEGRVTGAAERLVAWAEARGLAGGQWLGYMWEDPEIVPIEKCRYDVAVEVPEPLRPDGEIGTLTFPPMTLAELPLAGSIDLEQRALDWLYKTWLPRSAYAPDDQPAFEAWEGLPFAHGFTHFELRLQLPVVSAQRPL